MDRFTLTTAILATKSGQAASRDSQITRSAIELSAALARHLSLPVGHHPANANAEPTLAEVISTRHFSDERWYHIALFAYREEAIAFMLDLVANMDDAAVAAFTLPTTA